MTSLMPRHTVSSGCSCAGAALSTASARISVSSWSGKIASSLERKWRKKVRRATPAAAAISSTVVASYPLVANSSMAAAASSRRILSRWAAARLPAALSGASGVAGVREDLAGWGMPRTYCMCAARCACPGFPPPSAGGGPPVGPSSPPQSSCARNQSPTPSAAGIFAEAAAGLAAEAARGHQVLQERRGRQARVAELAVQDLLDGERDIEPDDVQQLEGAHRIAAAQLHRRVDVVERRVVFLHHLDRVVQVREEQRVHDEAGPVAAVDRVL